MENILFVVICVVTVIVVFYLFFKIWLQTYLIISGTKWDEEYAGIYVIDDNPWTYFYPRSKLAAAKLEAVIRKRFKRTVFFNGYKVPIMYRSSVYHDLHHGINAQIMINVF